MDKLARWHDTKPGLLIFSLLEFSLVYGFGSLAIDTGNLWWYLLTVIFLVGGVRNMFKLIKKLAAGS